MFMLRCSNARHDLPPISGLRGAVTPDERRPIPSRMLNASGNAKHNVVVRTKQTLIPRCDSTLKASVYGMCAIVQEAMPKL